MKNTVCWGLIFLSFISCEDSHVIESHISLGASNIEFKHVGGSSIIQLETDGYWEAHNSADWITLSTMNGDASIEIVITTEGNKEIEPREEEIIFTRENKKKVLTIKQSGVNIEMGWSSLPFSSFDDVSYSIGQNGIERTYHFKVRQLFINPELDISQSVFLGNLINQKKSNYQTITEYKDFTLLPITISSSIGMGKYEPFIPSKSTQDEFVTQILSQNPTASESFLLDAKGVLYNSHRELNLIGEGNLGINLDKIIYGLPYMEQEMTKRNGIIYSFNHTLFSLQMDMMDKLIKEELNQKDFQSNSISYISGVSYGRIGLLIIESDHDIALIKKLYNKIINYSNLDDITQEELIVLNELDAYHLYYDESRKLRKIEGKRDAIESYKSQVINDRLNVFPFKMTVIDYFEQNEANITFDIVLP